MGLQYQPLSFISLDNDGDDEDDGDIEVAHAGRISVTPIELDITAPEIGDWRRWIEESKS